MSTASATTATPTGMHPDTVRNGALVFAAGMALAAASFIVETLIIKTIKNR